jgi:hypothetical protein
VALGAHNRKVNCIQGLLCRVHIPSLDEYAEKEPTYTFDHYVAFDDLTRSVL